jgi:large subunit ribosomal protein L27e
MGKKKIAKRIRIRPFLKVTSLQHVLPTRCTFEAEFDKTLVNKESIKDPKKKRSALLNVKKQLEEHYKSGKSKWVFTKLRF